MDEKTRGSRSVNGLLSAQEQTQVPPYQDTQPSVIFTIISCLTLPLCIVGIGEAEIKDSAAARGAVTGWLLVDSSPLGTNIGHDIQTVETITTAEGEIAYHIVDLYPTGFVIVAADDDVEPIVAWADSGSYERSWDNPLGALVDQDVQDRILQARLQRGGALQLFSSDADGAPASTPQSMSTRAKWRELEEQAERVELFSHSEESSSFCVSDMRVPPLVKSRWDQTTVFGFAVYNYYCPPYMPGEPANYPCGCVATPMAQLMRYHEFPTTDVGTSSFLITVNGTTRASRLRGGDGCGGAYNWSLMPFRPTCFVSPEERMAIGALCHDAGAAVNMDYWPSWLGGSGANTLDAAVALKTVFKYLNAVQGYNSGMNIGSGLLNMLNPNLDAGCPVILGIKGPATRHAILVDGYGYNMTTEYHHLNLGWGEVDDVWYNLPSVDTDPVFDTVHKVVYNIFAKTAGEIISGRVTTPDGNPLPYITVLAERAGEVVTEDQTDARGIFALIGLGSDCTYRVRPVASAFTFTAKNITTGRSQDRTAISGNVSGVDFIGEPVPRTSCLLDVSPDGSAAYRSIQAAVDAARDGDVVVLQAGTYRGPGNCDVDLRGKAITLRSIDPNKSHIVANTVIECQGSTASPHRGLAFSHGESPATVVAGITIVGGYAEHGGAIYSEKGSSPRLVNCIFKQGIAVFGGAVCARRSSPTLINCLISGNTAVCGGGICDLEDSDSRLVNCTIVGNKSLLTGGGIANDPDCEPVLANCIVWRNIDPLYVDEWAQVIGGNPIVNNCAVEGWTGRLMAIGSHGEDPEFARAGYWTLSGTYFDRSDDTWVEGDCHCLATSPCIDAGDSLAIQHVSSDLDGNPRIVGEAVDMGVYECQSPPGHDN